MIHIDVINESTVVDNHTVDRWCYAVQHQVNFDVAGVWKTAGAHVVRRDKPIPGNWVMLIMDDSDVSGALGYHEDLNGVPSGKVFAKTDQKYGLNPCVTLSHEILEMVGDPWASSVVQMSNTAFTALELCDAVEADAFGYTIAIPASLGGGTETVSDFLTPAWFNAGDPGPFSYKHNVNAAFTLAKGGYMAIWTNGGWTQKTNFQEGLISRSQAKTLDGLTGRTGGRVAAGNALEGPDDLFLEE